MVFTQEVLKNGENIMDKCFRCGKEVFFDKPPEYDVCSRCDEHICINCGTPDPEKGDSMCKEHKGE